MSSFESFESRRFCLDGLDAQSRDIVTVREALVSCDPEALLAAVLHEKAGWRMPFETFGERQRRALFKRMSAVLAVMDATAPYEGEAPSLLIVPWERFELADSRGLFRRRVDAAAVDVADARKARETLRACGGRARSCTAVDAAQRAHAQLAEGDAWEWGCFGQRLDGFAFEPWARSLAHRVWLRGLCAMLSAAACLRACFGR